MIWNRIVKKGCLAACSPHLAPALDPQPSFIPQAGQVHRGLLAVKYPETPSHAPLVMWYTVPHWLRVLFALLFLKPSIMAGVKGQLFSCPHPQRPLGTEGGAQDDYIAPKINPDLMRTVSPSMSHHPHGVEGCWRVCLHFEFSSAVFKDEDLLGTHKAPALISSTI